MTAQTQQISNSFNTNNSLTKESEKLILVDDNIITYGAINSKINFREIRNSDLLILSSIFLNIYASKRLLYPFTESFSQYYNVSIQSFSYILATYEIGAFTAICLTLFPRPPLHNVSIHFMLISMMLIASILYLILSFSKSLISLYAIRIITGFIFATTQAQVRGILATFLKSQDILNIAEQKLSFGVMSIEASWFVSAINWVFVGIILHRGTVNYVWLYQSVLCLITAICCYFLPHCTVSQALRMKKQQSQNSMQRADINAYETSLCTQYHLYFFFIGYICVSLTASAWYSTFGAWLTDEFDLNPESLGVQTITISVAETVGFLICLLMQKYQYENINIAKYGQFLGTVSIAAFVLILHLNIYNEACIWILIFLFTAFYEMVYLSLIVANLELTPKSLESKSSLLFGTLSSLAIIFGVVIGPHIVKWFDFQSLLEYIFIVQCCAFVGIYMTQWQFKRHKMKLLHGIDSALSTAGTLT